MLRASEKPQYPYLLILDEMNLAHVERYFGDFLSGIESGTDVIPNLVKDGEDNWRIKPKAKPKLPIPRNLIVIGTVNVDETTYMFSPKVLDRANTLEMRVQTDELSTSYNQLQPCKEAPAASLEGIVKVMADSNWPAQNPGNHADDVVNNLRTVHRILSKSGFEFGHRTFNDAIRFSALFEAAGGNWQEALDAQVYQKVLPKLHGSQRAVGNTLRSLGHFCRLLPQNAGESLAQGSTFNFDEGGVPPQLPLSYPKLARMYERLRLNQFTTFTE
jgi:5-methylcytosine-specific restriction enzyme B